MRPPADRQSTTRLSWTEWLLQKLLSPRVMVAAILAALVVLVVPAIPGIWQAVEQTERFRLTEEKLELPAPPDSVPRKIIEQTWNSHPEWAQRNLLEWSLARDIAKGFAEHPWIASVDRVEKSRTGRVLVTVQYRIPIAVVETHRGLFPIDGQGVLLPSSDFSLAESNALPRVRGIRSIPNGKAGTAWGDPVVAAAARICAILTPNQELDRYWTRYQLEALVAPSVIESNPARDEEMTFELVTTGGQRIIWGHPPGADALEPTPKQKLGRLDHYLSQYQTLHDPQVAWIDVTPPEGTSRRLRAPVSELPAGRSTQKPSGEPH